MPWLSALWNVILGVTTLAISALANPWLIARLSLRCSKLRLLIPVACATSIVLQAGAVLILDVAGIPVLRDTLQVAHSLVFLALVLAYLKHRPQPLILQNDDGRLLLAIAAFAVLVFPYTALAGIDTYRWQCLASVVRLEKSIPWLVHPLSLLGYTARSYPSAMPLTLAGIQIISGAGVEGGFYMVSIITGTAGLFAMRLLLERLRIPDRSATATAVLYLACPVFMRYAHWATGRGFVCAFFPMLVYSLLARRPITAGLSVILLVLSHKAGQVGVVLLLPAAAAAACVPPRLWSWAVWSAVAAAVFLAIPLAGSMFLPPPAGNVLGAVWRDVSRFGILAPLAALSLPSLARARPAFGIRLAFWLLVICFPIAHHGEMYGALLAIAPIAVLAGLGLNVAQKSRFSRSAVVAVAVIAVVGALAVLGRRTLAAAPYRLRRAAQAIERDDPEGPNLVEAPPGARRQLHAYVSGCPRFSLSTDKRIRWRINPPPAGKGNIRGRVQAWIDWARNVVEPEHLDVAWYGVPRRTYYVRIDGRGPAPPGSATRLYAMDGITIDVEQHGTD